MSRNHFINFGTGTGKEKSFPGVRDGNRKYTKLFPLFATGMGNLRNHSCCLGQGREITNFIPVKRGQKGKFENTLEAHFFSLKI